MSALLVLVVLWLLWRAGRRQTVVIEIRDADEIE